MRFKNWGTLRNGAYTGVTHLICANYWITSMSLIYNVVQLRETYLEDQIESIRHEIKFKDSKDGECVVKIVIEYHVKGNVVLKDEDIKASKERSFGLYKSYVDYLNANVVFEPKCFPVMS
ncbi:pathogenesis-related protein STH-21-like [Olea europaea var. sylvestris]|uniref:pathogenesis-related protein STH-21-like n=1 Tax=Olea europaea var. sylvestris TaxID=158386 RepID=UPI000C1D8D2C|nr:pathogenesis-related protein STH-21-like [Olea europaea var. sylvestris]